MSFQSASIPYFFFYQSGISCYQLFIVVNDFLAIDILPAISQDFPSPS